MQGEEYTQQTYCQRANAFKQQWLQSHPEVNSALQAAIQVSRDMSALMSGVACLSLMILSEQACLLFLQEEAVPGDNENAAAKVLEEQYW